MPLLLLWRAPKLKYCGTLILTDCVLAAQCPDIVMIDKHQKAVQIVDIAVPSDCNVTIKESKKIEKYKDPIS